MFAYTPSPDHYVTAIVIVIVAAQLWLIAALLKQRAKRLLAEETIRACESALRTSAERIRQLASRLIHAQEPARAMIPRDLHDGLGLGPALQAHGAEFARQHDVEVIVETSGEVHNLSPDLAICFFRIAEESLRNGVAHGHAHRFTMSLCESEAIVELNVTDDGAGFDLEAIRQQGHDLGLVSMEERAYTVGAVVRVFSSPGEGTTVRVSGLDIDAVA